MICRHCHDSTEIGNPSGFCDHLHYPEYCETCKKEVNKHIRDYKAKESLIKYLNENTEERLWQAIRNWSKYDYIYVSDNFREEPGLKDTFYIEEDKENEKDEKET